MENNMLAEIDESKKRFAHLLKDENVRRYLKDTQELNAP
jgi:hypothetical protein